MKKKFLCIMLVLMMLFTSIPAVVFANKQITPFAGQAPFTASDASGTNLEIVGVIKGGYQAYNMMTGTYESVDCYIVDSKDADTVTLTYPEEVQAYNYTANDEYLYGFYDPYTQGSTTSTHPVDASPTDLIADYIRVQVPYSEADGGKVLYAISFQSTKLASNTDLGEEKQINRLSLLENNARKLVNTTDPWEVAGMINYNMLYGGSAPVEISAISKQQFINNAIAAITDVNSSAAVISKNIIALSALGCDVTKLYAVNSNVPINAISKLNARTITDEGIWAEIYALIAYAQGSYGNSAKEKASALLSDILAKQEDAGSWDYYDMRVDTTGLVLEALAFYPNEDGVSDAITKGVSYLQTQIDGDGYYYSWGSPNACSTALAITGLAAVGEDITKFKNSIIATATDIVTGLLKTATYNQSIRDYDSFANDYEAQAFRGLIAAVFFQNAYGQYSYNINDFRMIIKTPTHATGVSEPPVVPTDSGEPDKITVSVTIKGLYGNYILSSKRVSISKNSAVYVAFDKACKEAGINVVYRGLNYVESINGLGEFDKGLNSGWLYKVNGELPIIGIGENILTEDSEVLFYFTEDWTLDEDATAFAEPKKKVTEAAIKAPFVDIAESDWFYDDVQKAYTLKLFEGIDETHFAPQMTFSRGMLATVLYRQAGTPKYEAGKGFNDIIIGEWYSDGAFWAQKEGIFDGYPNGDFDPNGAITREQVALVLMRYSQYMKLDVSKLSNLEGYYDVDEISDWALTAMKWANAAGIINGSDNSLNPTADSSRAEAAAMLVRFIEKYLTK